MDVDDFRKQADEAWPNIDRAAVSLVESISALVRRLAHQFPPFEPALIDIVLWKHVFESARIRIDVLREACPCLEEIEILLDNIENSYKRAYNEARKEQTDATDRQGGV